MATQGGHVVMPSTTSLARVEMVVADCRTVTTYLALHHGDKTSEQIMDACGLSKTRWRASRSVLLKGKQIGIVSSDVPVTYTPLNTA